MAKDVVKKKRKKWYPILASQEFRQIEIGETTTSSPDSLIGRTVNANLSQLTRDMKKQNLNRLVYSTLTLFFFVIIWMSYIVQPTLR